MGVSTSMDLDNFNKKVLNKLKKKKKNGIHSMQGWAATT